MISQARISPKDMEELCAYIDNELTEQERSSFEEKLARSVVLQKALIDQRKLCETIRAIPARKAPRNFTLTTLEAREARKGRFLLPLFSWASVLAVALLAVLMVSEFAFKNFAVATAPMETQAPILAMGAESDLAAEPTTNPPLITWSYPYVGGGAGGSGLPNTAQAQPIPPYYGLGGGPAAAGKQGAEEGTPTETPTLGETPAVPVEATPIIFGIREDALGQVIETSHPAEFVPLTQIAEAVAEPQGLVSPAVKLTLAGLAVVFGLAALFLYRKR